METTQKINYYPKEKKITDFKNFREITVTVNLVDDEVLTIHNFEDTRNLVATLKNVIRAIEKTINT